jgi:hypothetical protein
MALQSLGKLITIKELIYFLFLLIYSISIGFIYLSYPIIMLRPESTDLMDRILNTGAMDMKIQLMKVFSDFLVAEQQKINTDLEDKSKYIIITYKFVYFILEQIFINYS